MQKLPENLTNTDMEEKTIWEIYINVIITLNLYTDTTLLYLLIYQRQ